MKTSVLLHESLVALIAPIHTHVININAVSYSVADTRGTLAYGGSRVHTSRGSWWFSRQMEDSQPCGLCKWIRKRPAHMFILYRFIPPSFRTSLSCAVQKRQQGETNLGKTLKKLIKHKITHADTQTPHLLKGQTQVKLLEWRDK